MQPVDDISNHGQGPLSARPPGNTTHVPHWVIILVSCLCVVCIFMVGVYGAWAVRKAQKESVELKAKTRDVEEGSVSSIEGDLEIKERTDLEAVVLSGDSINSSTSNAVRKKGEHMEG